MEYLMGLDIGTTNIKALVISRTGEEEAFAKRPSPFTRLPDGRQGYEPEALWDEVCALLQTAMAKLEEARPGAGCNLAGVAVASMGEMGVPLGREGPLYPAVAWHDTSSVPQSRWLEQRLGNERLQAITGQRAQHIFTVAKLLWLKAHEAEVYHRMERWACISDYIAYRLGGVHRMDYSIASRTGLLDWRARQWSEEILAATGIDRRKLPDLVPSGSAVGQVDEVCARRTGLPVGVRVFAGGHDHICGALAAGAICPGVFLDSCGTAEVLLTTTRDERCIARMGGLGFNVGCHTARDRCYLSGGMPASGASVDWLVRELSPPSALPDTVGSLLFLPHLRGSESPSRDSRSKGAFLGLTTEHTAACMLQSVYEGLAFQLRLCAERLGGGAAPRRLIAIGGGTKNHRWMQTRANVLALSIEIPRIQEATAMGAALLAGLGAGLYRNEDDAVKQTFHTGRIVEPNGANRAYYEEKYAVYKPLYETLLPIHTRLSALACDCPDPSENA